MSDHFNSPRWIKHAWPLVNRLAFAGRAEWITTEMCECQSCTALDRDSGIDGHIQLAGELWGCAVREQMSYNYRSFTWRLATDNGSTDTEKKKRIRSLHSGSERPYYTAQYYGGGTQNVTAIGLIRTATLAPYMANANAYYDIRCRAGQDMRAVDWDTIGERHVLRIEIPARSDHVRTREEDEAINLSNSWRGNV